ncbi:hypothetical protein J1605_001406 [Eschrichtius robustus]|uniref:protein phosphatase methylesterase-1 n=1 Tax=Eschrichtius robustus TaxID=9764 RepID=A0AB34HZR4_ESCRO|nr:hypothetical protein J1605_001406 [Eschrichtius robustus]
MQGMQAAIISRVQCRIVALDLRGHGETKVKNSEDLSAETMAKDVGNVVEAMYGDLPPPIMLIGHSMGGAIAVHTASSNLVPSLLGLCMIDVVEGTAMDALNSMQNFLRGRPKTFKSLENAVEWSVKSGQIRNLESARVSMVGQVKQCEGITSPEGSKSIVEGIIEEEEEDEEGSESVNKRKKEDDMEVGEGLYSWKDGVGNGSKVCKVRKGGVDRLDKDLTIGQMQGKFQMQVLPQCGHAVHEDAPDKVAEAVATFLIRHRFAEPIGGFQCLSTSYALPAPQIRNAQWNGQTSLHCSPGDYMPVPSLPVICCVDFGPEQDSLYTVHMTSGTQGFKSANTQTLSTT